MENQEHQNYVLTEAFGRLYQMPEHMVKMFNDKREAVEDWSLEEVFPEAVSKFRKQYAHFEI